MFEGLDSIEWAALGYHVYGHNERIPDETRNLLSSDGEERQQALGFLLGSGQDFGDIYDTTPHILPFLIEILSDPSSPGMFDLLSHLSGVASHISNSGHLSIHMMRLSLQTYDALRAGLGPISALLVADAPEVRGASAHLLQHMTDEVEGLIPLLLRRFRSEPEQDVRVEILKSLKALLASFEWARYPLKDEFAPLLEEIVQADDSQDILVAAAAASVELLHPIHPISRQGKWLLQKVPTLLSERFLHLASASGDPDHGNASFEMEEIARDLTRFPPQPLLALLQTPGITAEAAHILTRALLANVLTSSYQHHWEYPPDSARRHDGIFYAIHHGAATNIVVGKTSHYLRAVIRADKVWEIPTNLFSFFFGLPDTRASLEALLFERSHGTRFHP